MGERRVSADGQTYVLKPPFLVLATQNPVDQEGTFPLPEAQLDRFLVRLSLGYPSFEEESKMLTRLQKGHPIDDLQPVARAEDVLACQEEVRGVHVDEKIKKYILDIVHASREHEDILLGGSPRASIALFRTGQALAAIQGRDFVTPDDVKRMAHPVLAHRIILRPESRLRKKTPAAVVTELVTDAKVPVLDRAVEPNGAVFSER
jgi:MoxR-like ATPase